MCEIENILVIVHDPLKKSELGSRKKKKKHQKRESKRQNGSVVRQKKRQLILSLKFTVGEAGDELVAVCVSAILENVRRSWHVRIQAPQAQRERATPEFA